MALRGRLLALILDQLRVLLGALVCVGGQRLFGIAPLLRDRMPALELEVDLPLVLVGDLRISCAAPSACSRVPA